MNTYKLLGKHLNRNVIKGQIHQTLIRKSATQLCRPTNILCNSNNNLGRHQNFLNCFDSSKEVYSYSGLITRRNYYGHHYGGRDGRRYKYSQYEYEYEYVCENGKIDGILFKTKMALKRSVNWLLASGDALMEYVAFPSIVIVFAAPCFLVLKWLLWDTFVYGPSILRHGKDHVIRERLKRLKAEEEEEERKTRQKSKKEEER